MAKGLFGSKSVDGTGKLEWDNVGHVTMGQCRSRADGNNQNGDCIDGDFASCFMVVRSRTWKYY